MQRFLRFLREHSLSIAMFALFVICFFGDSVASWQLKKQQLTGHGGAAIGFWQNFFSSSYVQELASNWQAAFLQLTSLIVFSVILYQRGASHSRDPNKRKNKRKTRGEDARFPWLYRNSLSVAFVLLFGITFALHIVSGAFAYNGQLALQHRPPISVGSFLVSAKFWSSTLETWQAEYLTIAVFIVLSVFLRQQGSPESKPTKSSDKETGKTDD
ncbi:MAG: DUF6766 family protein [Rhodanobacteraceae bacterium]